MHIIHIASEFAPLAKAGGLGDAVFGLAEQQKRQNNHVTIIMPCYGCIDRSPFTPYMENFYVKESGTPWKNTLWQYIIQDLQVLLVEMHHPRACFRVNRIYCGSSDVRRFLFFSKIVSEFLLQQALPCDILHIHDWHTALLPYLLQSQKGKFKSIFTIHNIKYQGRCHPKDLLRIGLIHSEWGKNPTFKDPHNADRINILKLGLKYSDQITTVSSRYAKEISSLHFGYGLDPILCKREKEFTGITNGIDYRYWNPKTDSALAHSYAANPAEIEHILQAKQENKAILCQRLGLTFSSHPLIVVISRLVSQKGPQLIIEGLRYTQRMGGSFIVLGAVGEPQWERPFSRLQDHYQDHPQISIQLQFNEQLSRLLFASADCILVPSLFEPCGLTQMIALRYGTIPIVRKTGGLADTVIDPIEDKLRCTGITFTKLHKQPLQNALKRAFHYYYHDTQLWHTLIRNGLQQDFSWTVAEKAYATVYTNAFNTIP